MQKDIVCLSPSARVNLILLAPPLPQAVGGGDASPRASISLLIATRSIDVLDFVYHRPWFLVHTALSLLIN